MMRSAEEIARQLDALAEAAGAEADQPQTALEDSMYQSGLQFAYNDSAERVRAIATQQPRDLAGRIRALVQQKAAEWLDAEGITRHRLDDALDDLRFAYQRAKTGNDITPVIDAMREGAAQSSIADELEAIVRECEEKR